MTVKFDFHTHHERCGHADGTIRDYIEQALANGLDMIGISDHSPYFGEENDHPHPGLTMAKSAFPDYVREVLDLKAEYAGKIEVLLGVESDYFPESFAIYRREYEKYPFDYIIGSVHVVGGLSIFNKNRWRNLGLQEQIAVKEQYYQLITQSAQSGAFDILGHIDAMKGYYPEFSDIPTDAEDRALKAIAAANVAIEINTSGKTKYVGGWYPSDQMLEKALHFGVQVTFGSDAHVPNRVGDEWEQVRKKLKDIGFKQWAVFRKRQRIMVDL
ncbi:MAG TPA: histidinol-phosphatase [Bacilli bacterium]